MHNILEIATLFLAFLAFGSALLLPFFPLRAAGQSFARYTTGQNIFFQGLFLLCLYRLGKLDQNFLMIAGLGFWTWCMTFMTAEISRIELFLIRAMAVVALLFLVKFPANFVQPPLTGLAAALPLATFLISAIFLSFFLLNMIFGHWYLTNRELDIVHLVKTSRWLIIVTWLRVISVALAIFVAAQKLTPEAFTRMIDFTGHGVFFWARLLAGLLVPVIVVHLSYASARIKSNQSATGILYAGCVFVIMGELMALYLYSLTGVVF